MAQVTPRDMAAIHQAAFTQSRAWSEAEFASLLSPPLCFACGDARGFALVRVVADEAELLTIATHPDHQRKGIARAVMEAWQAEAHSRGATRAFLEVAADNSPAIGLYVAQGYIRDGLRRGYYQRKGRNPVDALLFSRNLPF